MQLKIDFHVHSFYSYDSLITPEQLAFYATKRGLDAVAVTDHDKLDGAVKISRESSFLVIPGMEISSADGHVIGLNIQEPVPRGLGADETVDRIHHAGGIALACHPIAFFKGSLGKHTSSRFDAVEVMNASAFPFKYSVKRSERLAARLRLPRVAGSDAHCGPEIGYAYALVESEPEIGKILNAVKQGLCEPVGEAIPFRMRLRREYSVFKKNLFGLRKT